MDISQNTISQLVSGSQRAFHKVFITSYPKVFSFSLRLVKNRDDAEDIAQTVFIRLWTKRDLLINVQNLDSYLYSMVKHTVLNYIKSKRGITVDISKMNNITNSLSSPQEQIEAKDLKLLVDLIVENMPKQRRIIYKMSREQGMSNDDIALKMGLQKRTVENHIHLALKEIKRNLPLLFLIIFNCV